MLKQYPKHKNDLVYFSGLLNFAKTEANTIVKGSPIVNTRRGLGRVNHCTLLERNSSILRDVWDRLLFMTWEGVWSKDFV